MFSCSKILFYCHYPDQLLSKPGGLLKRLYRKPLDWFEQYSTGAADEILVNSGFTKKVFRATFSSLNETPVEILYPALDTSKYEKMQETADKVRLPENALIISSVNRYERKKVKL
jgi:alpha-1,3/alpha-1,6-mannosyltransferase